MRDAPSAIPARRRIDAFLAPGARYYLMASAFFTAVFAIIPLTIYAHSGEDWGFSVDQLLPVAALGLVLFIGLALVIRLVAALHAGVAATAAVVLFCLGVFLLLAHVYAPIQIGPLDGRKIKSDEPILYTAVEFGLLLVSIFVFLQLRRGRGLTIAAWFSAALVVVGCGYVGVLEMADRGDVRVTRAAGAQQAPVPTAGSFDIEGNVYQIVLDRMQTDALLYALEQAQTKNALEGFELFKNNISNYVWTLQSAASYFTGTYYSGEDYDRWIRRWQDERGLLAALADRGYQIWMYSALPAWRSRYVDHLERNVDIYDQESGFAGAGVYDLLHIWLASLAPNPLTNEALPLAATLAGPIFELSTGRQRPLSWLEGLHQVAGVLMLRKLVREEPRRAPNGVYVYAHALLPHGPHVLDRDCRLVGPTGKRTPRLTPTEGYLLQAQCALGLVVSFLDELKRLGRYDAATIVIHGDTGDWMPLGKTKERRGKILGYPRASLLSYVQALLMIKRPHADGPLRILETPTELVDLYPTLADVLGLAPPPPDVRGRSIYSKEADAPREARVAFDPTAAHLQGSNLIEVQIDEPRSLRTSPLTVLGPAADPATWRDQVSGAVTTARP